MPETEPRGTRRCVAGAAAVLFALLAPGPALPNGEEIDVDELDRQIMIVGRHERVAFADGGVLLAAKVDTGADSSSIDARNVEEFERDGDPWVRFEVNTNDGKVVTMERPVVDDVIILQAGEDRERRLVVALDICVGEIEGTAFVTLANREGLDFRMLLGKGFLAENTLLVNVAQEYSAEPSCDGMVER